MVPKFKIQLLAEPGDGQQFLFFERFLKNCFRLFQPAGDKNIEFIAY
jgi:hypothetical protein